MALIIVIIELIRYVDRSKNVLMKYFETLLDPNNIGITAKI